MLYTNAVMRAAMQHAQLCRTEAKLPRQAHVPCHSGLCLEISKLPGRACPGAYSPSNLALSPQAAARLACRQQMGVTVAAVLKQLEAEH